MTSLTCLTTTSSIKDSLVCRVSDFILELSSSHVYLHGHHVEDVECKTNNRFHIWHFSLADVQLCFVL